MKVDQKFIVAGRLVIELAFRNLLSVAAWNRNFIPMGPEIDDIKKPGTNRKKFPCRLIVFGLENDQKRAVFPKDAARPTQAWSLGSYL